MLRFLLLAMVCLASAAAQPAAVLWKHLPPGSARLTLLEWRKVLDSQFREAVWREVPPEVLPLLSGINFIDGIERVLVSGQGPKALLLLQGKFDLAELKEQATGDGGVVKPYRKAELLLSPDANAQDETSQMALAATDLVMVGPMSALVAALDQAASDRPAPRVPLLAVGADLWTWEKLEGQVESNEFRIELAAGLRLTSQVISKRPEAAQSVAVDARSEGLQAETEGGMVTVKTYLPLDRFEAKGGTWRTRWVDVAMAEAKAPQGPQKVRILGLDDGPKEVPLGTPPKN